MTVNTDRFTQELDQLLGLRPGPAAAPDPALRAATVLLALDLEAESAPPAGLRARWVSRAQHPLPPERKSLMTTLRARPLVAALLALLILLALTGVAYAIGRSLGYIPGVGLVDQNIPLRVLAEPVSMTRDGVTITVEEAVLASDKTVIAFTVDGIPVDKLSNDETANKADLVKCNMSEGLRLPDGTLLKITGGQGEGDWGIGYRNRHTYAPIPAGVNEAVLIVPCIAGARPGALPENWELPLRFVPAPAGMGAVPVIQYTPVPEVGDGTAETDPITITRVIDLPDSMILIGEFAPPLPAGLDDSMLLHNEMTVTDGDGQYVNWETPQDFGQAGPAPDKPFVEEWAIQVAKGFTPPLTIKYSNQYSYPYSPEAPLEFEFDAGENPQPGDVWQVNKEFHVDGHVFTLATIEAFTRPCFPSSGYGFVFTSPETFAISTVTAAGIDGYTPVSGEGNCTGGGGGGMDAGMGSTWTGGLEFAEMPRGKLTVRLSVELYSQPREWTLQWQPGDSSPNSAAPAGAPQACLTMDSWKAAVQNPLPIPTDLAGRLIAYGRILEDSQDPSPENSGEYVMDFDGSNKWVIGQDGNAPSLSPDGTQAVYDSGNGGLYIADLASGEKHQIPNTTADDYGPRWSPDGKWIAFMHYEILQKGIIKLSLIHPDGTGLQSVSGEFVGLLIGWTSDGTGLFYGEVTKDNMLLKKLDIASGATGDLFAVHDLFSSRDYDIKFDISPDEKRISFFDQVNGSSLDGWYVSNMDGSDRKLISFQTQPWTFTPVWSPDGKWLMTYVWNNSPDDPGMFALVNAQDCRIIPLPGLADAQAIWDWIP
jgi:hypothetical protein